MIGVRCDRCGTHFWAKDEAAGRSASCARCGQILRVPDPPDTGGPEPPRRTRERVPEPAVSNGPSAWLPRDPTEGDREATLVALLRTARQIRFLLVVLIAIGIVLLGLLVALSARVFFVRVVN